MGSNNSSGKKHEHQRSKSLFSSNTTQHQVSLANKAVLIRSPTNPEVLLPCSSTDLDSLPSVLHRWNPPRVDLSFHRFSLSRSLSIERGFKLLQGKSEVRLRKTPRFWESRLVDCPPHLYIHILSFLPVSSVCRLSRVSRYLFIVGENKELWRALVRRDMNAYVQCKRRHELTLEESDDSTHECDDLSVTKSLPMSTLRVPDEISLSMPDIYDENINEYSKQRTLSMPSLVWINRHDAYISKHIQSSTMDGRFRLRLSGSWDYKGTDSDSESGNSPSPQDIDRDTNNIITSPTSSISTTTTTTTTPPINNEYEMNTHLPCIPLNELENKHPRKVYKLLFREISDKRRLKEARQQREHLIRSLRMAGLY